ncbi:MAG: CPBP family intramembrane glutamic endopeptidase [Anaerolineae bacterium]|nr:CPBP family intramembrane metalloprotease [Anaerolineae bacterium]MDW8098265.1 CPBP family intramembrane glutamic endopeptidase [Anaerolineae bacterium]
MNDLSTIVSQDALQALAILVMLIPFAVTLALANLSVRMPSLRWLAYAMLTMLSGGFLLIGILAFGMAWISLLSGPTGLEWGLTPNWDLLGAWGLATGFGALLALTPPVRSVAGRLLTAFDPSNPVHAVSLGFAVFLVGLTATQLVMLGDLEHLADAGVAVGPMQIWAQGIGLTAIGLIGIGLWTRRSWTDVVARLGLARLSRRTWLISAAFIALFMAIDFVWMQVWHRFDPEGMETISRVSGALFARMLNLPGALTIGITAAVSEEIVYRGALQPRFGLLPTAALFAISHVQYGLSPAVVEIFVIGLVLGLIRRRYDLTTCILIHFGYNTLNLLLLPPGQ